MTKNTDHLRRYRRSTPTARSRRRAEQAQRHSRRGFLRTAASRVGGAAAASGLLPGAAQAAGTPKGDVAILNFALTLEYLESRVLRVRAQARRPDRRAEALRHDRPRSTRRPMSRR